MGGGEEQQRSIPPPQHNIQSISISYHIISHHINPVSLRPTHDRERKKERRRVNSQQKQVLLPNLSSLLRLLPQHRNAYYTHAHATRETTSLASFLLDSNCSARRGEEFAAAEYGVAVPFLWEVSGFAELVGGEGGGRRYGGGGLGG